MLCLLDPEYLQYLRDFPDWISLNSILMILNQRKLVSKFKQFSHYYIASPVWKADRFFHNSNSKRIYWGMENSLSCVLVVVFQEDHHELRKDHCHENFSDFRHVALILLKQEHSIKAGIKAKRLRTGWDNAYHLKVLAEYDVFALT